MNKIHRKLGDKDVKTLDGGWMVDGVKIHVDAVDALASYAELLKTLLKSSQKDDLKKTIAPFVGSLLRAKAVDLIAKVVPA